MTTFDGQFTGFLCWDDLKKLVGQNSVLGPIAGMYGRNIQQVLMHPKRKTFYISERKFAHSVEAAKICLKREMLHGHPDKATIERSEQSDDDEREHIVEKMKELLRRQIKTNEWTSVSRHGRG